MRRLGHQHGKNPTALYRYESVLKLGLHRLPRKDFPHLRKLAPHLLDYDGKSELDQGMSVLLEGLQTSLKRSSHGMHPDTTSCP